MEITPIKKEGEESCPDFSPFHNLREEDDDYEYSIFKLKYPVKPGEKPQGISRAYMDKIESEFCRGFKKVFTERIKADGFKNYETEISQCMHYIHEMEVYGMALSGDKKITTTYYTRYNERIADAFNKRLDKRTYRYGGYSIYQICYDIEQAAREIDGNGKNKISRIIAWEGNIKEAYRIYYLTPKITHKISCIFAESRIKMREEYLRRAV